MSAGLFGGGAGAEPDAEEKAVYTAAMPLVRERLNFLHEAPEKLRYLFREPDVPPPEEFFPKKAGLDEAARLLKLGREITPQIAAVGDAEAEALVKAKAEEEEVKLGDLMMPLRAAITGARVSPPLSGSIRLLGAEKCLSRIDKALSTLESARNK